MDEDSNSNRHPASALGGVLEPAKHATVARARLQTKEQSSERYELRDPFSEVTYCADTFPEMVAKAEQIGSSRFIAVADDGKRTPIMKTAGEWLRGAQLPAAPKLQLDPTTARDNLPEAIATRTTAGTVVGQQQSQRADTTFDPREERNARVASIESALMDRYLITRAPLRVGAMSFGQTEYRFRGDSSRVAFTESTFRLATDSNSPSVARSMIDVAEARNWTTLRVSGHEDFKRLVWLEASLRGHKTIGYEPNPGDLELLKNTREARHVNRIEPSPSTVNASTSSAPPEKTSARGGGGLKAVLAAIEAVLIAKEVPEQKRTAVMAVAAEKLSQRLSNGQAPKVKLYDMAAPAQRPIPSQSPQMQRTRERANPSPTR